MGGAAKAVVSAAETERLKRVGVGEGTCESEGLSLMEGKVRVLELKVGRRFGWRSAIDKLFIF